MGNPLDLWDYRRRVADIYSAVREGGPGEEPWRDWVEQRDSLFRTHPESPIDDPSSFRGLSYFEHDPSWRVVARFTESVERPWGEFSKIGKLDFEVRGIVSSLPVYWLNGYGGGLFVPFGDRSNGRATYGGGRYLLDTAKGADLGHVGDSVTVDFNYAYHPSCVHSDRWVCPLASPESSQAFGVTAGERLTPSP